MKNNGNTDDDASNTDHKPTVTEYIVYHLYKRGRSTVAEIARNIGYSHDYTRKGAKDLKENGEIEGEKTDPVVGCLINNGLIVLTPNRDGMIQKLEDYAPNLAKRAKGENMTVDEIHDLIKKHAANVAVLENRWEFWYPLTPEGASSSEGVEAGADD